MKFRLEIIKDFKSLVKELTNGLRSLDFTNNFKSFEWTGTIAATTELKIRNELTQKPTKYIILYQTGNALITASDTTLWDNNFVYLKNNSATTSATVTVQFLQ